MPLEKSTKPAVRRENENDFVSAGLTRRFETNTPRLKQMLADLEVAARHDVTVLLAGETGSGKTHLSRMVHEISPRHDDPFLPVACGALPADLIESELFEHVIQRAVIYCRDGLLSAAQLPVHIVLCQPGPGHDGNAAREHCDAEDAHCRSQRCADLENSLGRQVALSEREIIQQTLRQNNDSRTNTARALGISRVTLYNKMKKYGMMSR